MTFSEYESSDYSGTPERLFLFTVGNVQWAYTNQQRAVIRGSIEHSPAIIAMGGISQDLGEASPTVEITMDVSTPVAQQFVPYQPVSPMIVTVFKRHRDDPADQYIVEFFGEVGATSFDEEEGYVTFACRLLSANFSRKVPWPIYQKPCNWALYSLGCGVNKEDYKIQTAVTSVVGTSILSSDFASKEDGWFRNGFVRRDSTGDVRFIVDHVAGELTLQTPFVELDPGESITAYAGCDRSFATCKAKFNNGQRFSGFEWGPSKNPFVDNVYGTGTPAGGGSSSNRNADSEYARFIK